MMREQYWCPFYPSFARAEAIAYIRLLHASPDAPSVDIYANNRLIAQNLMYKHFTDYLSLPPGNYTITVFPTGQTSNPVSSKSIIVGPDDIYTVAVINKLANLDLLPVPEPRLNKLPSKAYIRFVHLSPNAPALDITLPNGNTLFKNIGYKGISEYIPLDPGTYTLQARVAGTNQIALTVPNIRLRPNRIYTVYAVGLAGGNPPLEVLIPLDGSTYLNQNISL